MRKIGAILLGGLLCLSLAACRAEGDIVLHPQSESIREKTTDAAAGFAVIINRSSRTYHSRPDCIALARMTQANRLEITVPSEEYLLSHDYLPCRLCTADASEPTETTESCGQE